MKEDLYKPNSIRTYTGEYLDFTNLQPDMINIRDIAHALSNIPRFGGHLPMWYSVADHSLHVSYQVQEEYKLDALLHDAAEAYMMDIPSPLKKLLPDYQTMEKKVFAAIAEKFNLKNPMPDEVKAVDKFVLVEEWNALMVGRGFQIIKEDRERTEKNFIDFYRKLRRVA